MFGDDPDPTVTTVRVGFGTTFRTRARGGSQADERGWVGLGGER